MQNLKDRYREKITLNNNGILDYSRLSIGGFSPRYTDADMIESMIDKPFYKDRGITFDGSKVKTAGEIVYFVQSSPTDNCFVAYFIFGTATGESRQTARGDREVGANICYRATAKTAADVEREMLDILTRARYDDGAGNRTRYAPAAIHADALARASTYCYDAKLNVVSTPSPPSTCVSGDQQVTEEFFNDWRRTNNAPGGPTAKVPAEAKALSARLKQLEDAYRQNLLTRGEYEATRKAILDSM